MQKVVVYGGGNIAHSLAAVISATQQVFVVTRRPNEWHSHLKSEKDGVINSSKFFIEATDNHAVIEGADVLFICLPQLLHPSRLIVLFDKWREKKFTYNPPFYGEWTDASSELYLAADYKMKCVMQKYSCFDMLIDHESVLDHYNVKNAHELTVKLQSISSFREILSPMKKQGELWVPDFESRYFTEDVNFVLRILVEFAEKTMCQSLSYKA
jgi:hypothetical protein